MPTQRSFLGSFLAAFRVHSQPPIAKTSATALSGPSSGTGSSATLWTATTAVSLSTASAEHSVTNPRPIHSKPNPYLPSAGTGVAPPPSAAAATIQHNVSPQTHLGRSPSGPASPVYGPPNKPTPNYPTCQEVHGPRRRRRSSDSSSDSGRFGEARGAGGGEKFFIGGRTAGGEERYYKLSMVKRERSADRISADQLSL